jgi:hypothetical protein
MASTEMVEIAFGAFEVPRNPVLLAKGMEVVETTGDQLVGISLVPDIPDDPIPVKIEGLVQRQGELHNPQTRAEMATTGGDHLKMTLSNLTGDILKLRQLEAMQLIRMRQISEMHAPSAPGPAIYGVRSWGPLALNMGRMEG